MTPLAAVSDYVLIFIDDILIFSKTHEDQVEQVKIVMDVLCQNITLIRCLNAHGARLICLIWATSVSKDGIKVEFRRIKAVAD